jgi:hypothetical protein
VRNGGRNRATAFIPIYPNARRNGPQNRCSTLARVFRATSIGRLARYPFFHAALGNSSFEAARTRKPANIFRWHYRSAAVQPNDSFSGSASPIAKGPEMDGEDEIAGLRQLSDKEVTKTSEADLRDLQASPQVK